MNREFFGDSYDVVKASFLCWLSGLGEWIVHPMFTAPSLEWAVNFSKLLGCRLMTTDVLAHDTNREKYFSPCDECGHLFLDPDTGLKMRRVSSIKQPAYLLGPELISMARARKRRDALTLVFDQSVARGSERAQIEKKLNALHAEGLFAMAYVSHACFILVGSNKSLLQRARRMILGQSNLPKDRFIAT